MNNTLTEQVTANRGDLNKQPEGRRGAIQHPVKEHAEPKQAEPKKATESLESLASTVTARLLVKSARSTQSTIEINAYVALENCSTDPQRIATAVAEFSVLSDLVESWFSGDYQKEFPNELPIVAAMKGFLCRVDGGASKPTARVM